jgi:hypothetical protein
MQLNNLIVEKREQQGLGLGLYLNKTITKKAKVCFQEGTTISIILPLDLKNLILNIVQFNIRFNNTNITNAGNTIYFEILSDIR